MINSEYRLLSWETLFCIGSSYKIVNAYIVVIGELYQDIDRNGSDALLIPPVDFPLAAEEISNLLLCFIMVDP